MSLHIPHTDQGLVFFDFDGVICDSILECFVSSWLAHFAHKTHPKSISLEWFSRFRQYRPCIRRGGDYVILQECIDSGRPLSGQDDFDGYLAEIGPCRADELHRAFYEARSSVLDSDSDYWLALNPLYPHMPPLVKDAAEQHWIITTKQVSFASRILAYHGIEWPESRIICSGKERKLKLISAVLDAEGTSRAVLLDDQIDHLRPNVDQRIEVMLADWGYIKPEWISDSEIEVVTPETLSRRLREFL